jgi:hypothetical protein
MFTRYSIALVTVPLILTTFDCPQQVYPHGHVYSTLGGASPCISLDSHMHAGALGPCFLWDIRPFTEQFRHTTYVYVKRSNEDRLVKMETFLGFRSLEKTVFLKLKHMWCLLQGINSSSFTLIWLREFVIYFHCLVIYYVAPLSTVWCKSSYGMCINLWTYPCGRAV